MNELLPLILLVTSTISASFQLILGRMKRDIVALTTSLIFFSLLIIKLSAIGMNEDFGSNYQFIALFPLSFIIIIKTMKDIGVHPKLRVFLIFLFFAGALPNALTVNNGQMSYQVLKNKTNFLSADRRVLNIFFHPDNAFMEELALGYANNTGVTNTMIFSVPILTNQFERIEEFKNSYSYVNVIYVDLGEEKVAAGTLEAYLAKDYRFHKVDYKRLSFKEHILQEETPFAYKITLFKKK